MSAPENSERQPFDPEDFARFCADPKKQALRRSHPMPACSSRAIRSTISTAGPMMAGRSHERSNRCAYRAEHSEAIRRPRVCPPGAGRLGYARRTDQPIRPERRPPL